MHRRICRGTVMAAAALLAISSAAYCGDGEAEFAVAFVNSQTIAKTQVEKRLSALAEHALRRNMAPPRFEDALEYEIERELVIRAAEKEFDEQVKARLRQMATENASRETNALAVKSPPSASEIETAYEDLLLQAYLQKKMSSAVYVSPAEVKECYEKNKDRFTESATVTIREILIRQEKHSPEEAKALADKAYARAAAGEDFATVAKETGEGAYASSGGLWPKVSRGKLIREVEAKAFAAKAGDITEPFKSPVGWHVIKVEETGSGGATPYSQVQDRIFQELTEARRVEVHNQLIKDLKANAVIRIIGS